MLQMAGCAPSLTGKAERWDTGLVQVRFRGERERVLRELLWAFEDAGFVEVHVRETQSQSSLERAQARRDLEALAWKRCCSGISWAKSQIRPRLPAINHLLLAFLELPARIKALKNMRCLYTPEY